MSKHNNIYSILGKLASLEPKQEPVKQSLTEGATTVSEAMIAEKYMGFKKTVAAIEKGGSAENPEAVAASIGRKKYGKGKFQKAAAAGKKMGESTVDEEVLIAKQDYDGDGKKESPKDEYKGSKDKAIKKAMGKKSEETTESDYGWDEPEAKTSTSTSRKVSGTRYGGSAQKYDDDNSNDDNGTTAAGATRGRGRPRKHPLKDPNEPKRGRGRPRKVSENINLDTFVEDTMAELESIYLGEKAVSKAQQKFMGMVYATKKGEKAPSKEVAKVAKGMSKKSAKDFAKTKHKGLPQHVTEGVNFAEMVRETDQTVEEMLNELHYELDEYKRTGRMGEKLRDALDLHRHAMRNVIEPKVSHHADNEEFGADRDLDELAALAGLGSPVKEAACNMTAEGEMCPKHGFAECATAGMFEGKKPDFLDVDNDGDKKEPFKKALKDKEEEDKEQVEECDMGPVPGGEQQDSSLSVNTTMTSKGDKNVTVSATGDEAEKLMQILKLAGLGGATQDNPYEGPRVIAVADDNEGEEEGEEEVDEAEGDKQYTNSPDEEYGSTEQQMAQGDDLNRRKAQYADKPKAGDNPMATTEGLLKLEGRLAAEYEALKKAK